MNTFGLTMFSILIAIFGYFQCIPLTGINRLQDCLRKEYALGHFGMMVDRFSPVAYDNDSFASSEIQSDAPSAVVLLTSSKLEPVGYAVDTVMANFSASVDDKIGYTTDIVSLGADQNESYSGFFHDTYCPYLIAICSRYAGFPSQIWPVIKSFFGLAVPLGPLVILVGSLTVAFTYWRKLRTAGAEVMRLTSKVQSRRASLQRKIDLAASVVDQTLDEIARHIPAEQERIHQYLASFRPDDVINQEINAFREKLEFFIQSEFDKQIPLVRDYLEELEQVRQTLPGPVEIRAQCEKFQETFEQAKEVHSNLKDALKHIDELLRSKQTPSLSQVDDEFHAVRSISSNEGTGPRNVNERIRGNTGTRSRSLSRWVMASGRHEMTPEEFNKALEIRRERVNMRCANRVKTDSVSSNGQSCTAMTDRCSR